MTAVVQRVTEAAVHVENEVVGSIGVGLVALVAVCANDTAVAVDWMARKLTGLRIFRNANKHFDVDVRQAGGSVLLISNFTVSAETRHGRRPSFDAAADAHKGGELFAALVEAVRSSGIPTEAGRFRSDMRVHLVNDGPATFILNTAEPK